MAEVRVIWQALRKLIPRAMYTPDRFKKTAHIDSPNKLKATRNDGKIVISGDLWVRLPSKKRQNPRPQTLQVTIVVKDLTLDSECDIDGKALVKMDTEEVLKALFLAALIERGIFNDKQKRDAFKSYTKL